MGEGKMEQLKSQSPHTKRMVSSIFHRSEQPLRVVLVFQQVFDACLVPFGTALSHPNLARSASGYEAQARCSCQQQGCLGDDRKGEGG